MAKGPVLRRRKQSFRVPAKIELNRCVMMIESYGQISLRRRAQVPEVAVKHFPKVYYESRCIYNELTVG